MRCARADARRQPAVTAGGPLANGSSRSPDEARRVVGSAVAASTIRTVAMWTCSARSTRATEGMQEQLGGQSHGCEGLGEVDPTGGADVPVRVSWPCSQCAATVGPAPAPWAIASAEACIGHGRQEFGAMLKSANQAPSSRDETRWEPERRGMCREVSQLVPQRIVAGVAAAGSPPPSPPQRARRRRCPGW